MLLFTGDLMVDVFRDAGDERRHVGGKAAIWATSAAVAGAQTSVLGAVGRDATGDELLEVLRSLDIGTAHVVRTDEPTGADYFEGGHWVMERGANWAYTADHVAAAVAESVAAGPVEAIVVGQGLDRPTAEQALRSAAALGVPIVLNLGPEADEERRRIDPDLFDLADILVVNQREAPFLRDDLGLAVPEEGFEQLALALFEATRPRHALVLLRATLGAVVVTRQDDQAQVALVEAVADPVSEPEFSIGAGDSMLGTAVALAVCGSTPWTAQSLVPALAAGARVAALNHRFAGTLTAVVEAPEQVRAAIAAERA